MLSTAPPGYMRWCASSSTTICPLPGGSSFIGFGGSSSAAVPPPLPLPPLPPLWAISCAATLAARLTGSSSMGSTLAAGHYGGKRGGFWGSSGCASCVQRRTYAHIGPNNKKQSSEGGLMAEQGDNRNKRCVIYTRKRVATYRRASTHAIFLLSGLPRNLQKENLRTKACVSCSKICQSRLDPQRPPAKLAVQKMLKAFSFHDREIED